MAMIKMVASILGLLIFTALSAGAAPKRICTMTLNSNDEKEVLKNMYGGQDVEITELVPENKDPSWLSRACQSGIQCDVLLVSGHFGGVFFGEGVSTTLDLKEIEKLSCENSCPGILSHPKDVFLMGCNTLSSKAPDKRSIEEYVEVLIHNGFPRDLAERVAFARYSEYGMSISQIFSSAFQGVERLHGFSSTGPLGKVAAPLLRQSLKNTSKDVFFSKGPDTNRLKQVFAGTSYRMVQPAKEIDSNYRALTCKTYSQNQDQNKEAIVFLSKKTNLKKYYEPLLEASKNPSFLRLIQDTVNTSAEARQNFQSFFEEIGVARSLPLKMKFQFLDLQASLGLIPLVVKQDQQEGLLRQRLASDLNFIVTDQFCAMKDLLKNTELRGAWIRASAEGNPFLPRLSQCFGSYDEDIENILRSMIASQDSSLRREAIRALSTRISWNDKITIANMSASWPRRDRIDMAYFLKLPLSSERLSPRVQTCLYEAKQKSTADARDGYRWYCHNEFEADIDSPLKCHQIAREFETQSVTGMDWQCLTRFPREIHLGACLEAADRNPDPENSDDIRWFCWNRLSGLAQLSRSECLALASSMKIQGNRFKANWNCMNRLSY
nr:hypothetical protein [uncultured Bdellovibrio sp.]